MSLDTRAFDAQDSLVTLLQARTDLTGWSIDYGLPAGRPNELHIWVDEKVDEWAQEGRSTGVVTKDETFRLAVYLYARRTASSAQEIRDEVKAAGGVVADVVGQAPFLGGVVLYAEIVGGEYEGAFADPEGRSREGVLRLDVACTAFLTSA